jgi:hypothetical protein
MVIAAIYAVKKPKMTIRRALVSMIDCLRDNYMNICVMSGGALWKSVP